MKTNSNRYRCADCGLVRSHKQVDEAVLVVLRGRLARVDLSTLLSEGQDTDVSDIDDELAVLKSKLARVKRDYDDELIEARDLKRACDKYDPEIQKLEAKKSKLVSSTSLLDTANYQSPVETFNESSLAVKRHVIYALVNVRLRRAPRGKKSFDPAFIVFEWKTAST